MIVIPLLDVCRDVPELVRLLSDDIGLKVGEFDADNFKNAPYVCYQIIGTDPQQYLSDASDLDAVYVQIDVYAKSKDGARTIAKLMRKAIEEDYCHIISYTGVEKDTKTNLWRVRMDTSWYEDV